MSASIRFYVFLMSFAYMLYVLRLLTSQRKYLKSVSDQPTNVWGVNFAILIFLLFTLFTFTTLFAQIVSLERQRWASYRTKEQGLVLIFSL